MAARTRGSRSVPSRPLLCPATRQQRHWQAVEPDVQPGELMAAFDPLRTLDGNAIFGGGGNLPNASGRRAFNDASRLLSEFVEAEECLF